MRRPRGRRPKLLAVALLGLGSLAMAGAASGAASAAGPAWSSLGAMGLPPSQHATLWQLVADPANPSLLLAATSKGVLSSSDGGASWQSSPLTAWTWAVAFAPSGGVAYAGTESKGVYRSTDGGQSWSRDDGGLGSRDVRAIDTGPGAVLLGTASGVYLGDGGLGWESAGLGGTSISSLAIVNQRPLGVVAGSDSTINPNNLFSNLAVGSSTSWQDVSGADPQGSPVFAVGAGPLAQGASNEPILVANLKGLFLSTNGASSWQQVNLSQGALWAVNAIAFDPHNPSLVYVGGDNGGSTGGGLQRSLDGGSTWSVWQNGLPTADVTSLEVAPTDPVTVLAGLWNSSTLQAAAAKMVDTSAPGPVPLQASASTPIAISPPPAATPTPSRSHSQNPAKGAGLSMPAWAPPLLAAVLAVAAAAMVIGLRRRRTRLDAEAPP